MKSEIQKGTGSCVVNSARVKYPLVTRNGYLHVDTTRHIEYFLNQMIECRTRRNGDGPAKFNL